MYYEFMFFFPFGHTLSDILLPHFCLNHMIDLSFNEAKMLVAVTFQKVGDKKRESHICFGSSKTISHQFKHLAWIGWQGQLHGKRVRC